jgi:hypothetical protein
MSMQEELLRHTLAKVRDGIEPSPDLLDNIRAAVARAERRRRLIAVAITLAVLMATLLALVVLTTIRQRGADAPPQRGALTAVALTYHPARGAFDGEPNHD